MGRSIAWAYLTILYAFIFLPVGVLVLFSFQDGRLPVSPFKGPTLKWYEAVIRDSDLMAALGNSLLVALVSSALALILGFLAAHALAREIARAMASRLLGCLQTMSTSMLERRT